MTPWRRQLSGFTLLELVVNMAIMAILVGGMTSAVLMATHALPDPTDPSEMTATAVDAVDLLAADLAAAITITQAAPAVIEFAVPDRGHGAAGPETVRYAWSGTAGDPLTRRYNGGTASPIAQDVRAFSLVCATEAGTLKGPPRVLLVSADPAHPGARETATRAAMQSCGFWVQSIDDNCTAAQFATALQSADVVYTLPDTRWSGFGDKPTDIPQGVVIADTELYTRYGVASSNGSTSDDTVVALATPHPVTRGFSAGYVKICSSAQSVALASSTAPGATWLATAGFAQAALLAVDWGRPLTTGAAAAGRRIVVPSGTTSFDYATLTADGARLERNAILWAAAPKVVARVTVTVQVGADASARVASDVQLLNQPEAPR